MPILESPSPLVNESVIVVGMKWVDLPERENWQSSVESQGFEFHTPGHQYWTENNAYEFTAPEIALIKNATDELHQLCLKFIERVIQKRDFERLSIPRAFVPTILESWYAKDPTVYGRFDFCFDGQGSLKLLEYNADTPVTLLESSLIQSHWLEDRRELLGPRVSQFNLIHSQLVQAWSRYAQSTQMKPEDILYFSCVKESDEDVRNVEYSRSCARTAGLQTEFIFLEDMGWDGKNFVDLKDRPIRHCFKLYPWEILVHEKFAPHLIKRPIRMIEPAWKMILSNKAMLPLLWEAFEGHPLLLPTYFDPGPLGKTYVRKPIFSREGANITIVRENEVIMTDGDYGSEGYIYQQFAPLPQFRDSHAMIGSWVIGGESSGICIRESPTLITDNVSCLVPHYFQTE